VTSHRKRGLFINFSIWFLPHKICIDCDTVRPLTSLTGILPVLFAEFYAILTVTECRNLNKEFHSPRFFITLVSITKIKNRPMMCVCCACVRAFVCARVCVCVLCCVYVCVRLCVCCVCECCVSVLQCQLLTLSERKVISYIERPSLHRAVNTLHLG